MSVRASAVHQVPAERGHICDLDNQQERSPWTCLYLYPSRFLAMVLTRSRTSDDPHI